MHTQNSLFRFTAAIAIGSLLLGPVLAPVAHAQSDAPAADPPARVGRLAQVNGTVSFHTADATQWEPATLNYPVTSGNAFWTEPQARADIEVGASHIAMDQATEFDVDTLDDHTMAATLAQGEVYMRLNDVQAGETYQIRTPRGIVTIGQPGRYELTAGDTDHPTTVTVVDGLAQISGDGVSVAVRPRQTAQISGSGPFQAVVTGEAANPFLTAQLAADRPMPTGQYAPPPVVAEMTGGEALVETGTWQPTPEYGQVWYPPVDPGWVPYRHGHWAYVDPWGWTWVDDASWGFAPFHYGRWVEIGPRWGWVPVAPGYVVAGGYRPVYSPALVSFVGLGVGLAIGASVGWIPLGPREAYYPPYRHSDNYLRQVNVTHVTNITNNNVTINRFVNRGAATMVPASVMSGSQQVARRAEPVSAQALANARPIARPPVQPTARTAGVTPTVARQFNLPTSGPGAVAGRPTAPGPTLRAHPVGTAVPLRGATGAGAPQASPRGPGAPGPQSAPGPQGAPRAPGAAIPPGAPAAARPMGGAPGPAFAPRGQGAPIGGAPGLPQQRPTGQPGQAPGPRPQGATPAIPAPRPQQQQQQQQPSAAQPGGAQPGAAAPRPGPPQIQAPIQHAPPQLQHAAPPPQVQHAAPPPQVQHAAPPPQPQHAPPPVQHVAPPPQVQHVAPPPQQHAPSPPPPQPRPAAPPPVQRAAPPPAPRPAPAAEHRACPPGHPNC